MKTEMNTVKVRKTEELEAEQLGAHIGEIVRLHGSIYKIRKMSSFAFVLLRTKRQMVQCVYEQAYARFALEELKEEAYAETGDIRTLIQKVAPTYHPKEN